MEPKEFTSKTDMVRREREKERRSPRLFVSVTRRTKLLITEIRKTTVRNRFGGKAIQFWTHCV